MKKSSFSQAADIYPILMDSVSINIAVYEAIDDGEDFIFLDFNRASEITEDIKREELLGKRLKDIFPGVKEMGLFDVLKRVYQTGGREIFEPAFYQDERNVGWRKNLDSLGEIIDTSLNEIYIFDCHSLEFTYLNQGALNNLGYSYEEMMQMTPLSLIPFHTKESFTTLLEPLCKGSQKQLIFETVHRRKDRSLYDIEVRLQYLRKDERDQVFVMGIDITQRELAEKKLKASLEQLANTEKVAHFGGWEWNMQSNDLQWSDEVFRIFGEVSQSFTCSYEKFLSYLSESDQIKVEASINTALKNKEIYEVDHKIILKDGTERFVREVGEFNYDKNGKAITLIDGVMDITDYTRIKEALHEQERIYSQLFHQSTDGMMVSDDQLNTVDYNKALLKMLKYEPPEAMVGKQPFKLSPKYQPDGKLSIEKQSKIFKKIFTEGPQYFEWQLCQSDENLILTDVSVTPIHIDRSWKLHSVMKDITKRKEMEAELESFNEHLSEHVEAELKKNEEQTQHMLQQSRLAQMGLLISMIAHQWRQPLSSISAIAGTLTMDSMMGEYKKEFFEERLEAITKLSQHLSSTIDDFRGFFKEDKEAKETSLLEIVNSSLLIIGPTLKNKGIEIEETVPDTIRLVTYPNEIIQVFLNLLKNSEEAIDEKKIYNGKISITGYIKDETVHLSLKDNGGGVPEEIINKIFDPYFSTKMKRDGTGLGLYMSKTIIEEHCKGVLTFENIDNGSIFTINLPVQLQKENL